jgi:hypothetical protein
MKFCTRTGEWKETFEIKEIMEEIEVFIRKETELVLLIGFKYLHDN